MILSDFDKRRERGVGGDVAADVVVVLVGPYDHRERVPANVVLDGPLNCAVARIWDFLFFARNRIHIGRDKLEGRRHTELGRTVI